MFVIKKNGTNKFVSMPGSKKSYTTSIEKARKFTTKEDADRNCCGNEHSVNLYDILK